MENNNIFVVGFDKMPSCTFVENGETITQIVFPTSLVLNTSILAKGEDVLVNEKSYIIKDKIDIMGYTILKLTEVK